MKSKELIRNIRNAPDRESVYAAYVAANKSKPNASPETKAEFMRARRTRIAELAGVSK